MKVSIEQVSRQMHKSEGMARDVLILSANARRYKGSSALRMLRRSSPTRGGSKLAWLLPMRTVAETTVPRL